MTPPWKHQLATTINDKGKALADGWRQLSKNERLKKFNKPGVIPGVLSIICLSTALNVTDQWQVVVDGDVLGTVSDPKAIVSYVRELDGINKDAYSGEASLINTWKVTRAFNAGLGNNDENIQLLLQEKLQWGVQGAAILVDGKEVVALKDKELAEGVIERVKAQVEAQLAKQYQQIKLVSLNTTENVQIVEKAVTVDKLVDERTAEDILLYGNRREQRYIVSRGDTLSSIAASRGMRVTELTQANPSVQPTRLQIGQTLSLSVAEPFVHVSAVAEVTETKAVPYKTQYIKDSSLWEGQTTVVKAGKNGTQEVTSLVTTVNGKVVDSKTQSSKTLQDPVDAVVRQGTKKAAVTGTGRFHWPSNGSISSGYGWRWGKFHHAVDIAAPTGTAIRAADSGVVTFSGWKSSYGYVVEIDHGNGYTTLYAHCSKLLVHKGQKVTKAQTIAQVGRTGNATGPHVHFEIRYNGKSRNPMNYFK